MKTYYATARYRDLLAAIDEAQRNGDTAIGFVLWGAPASETRCLIHGYAERAGLAVYAAERSSGDLTLRPAWDS